MLLDSIVNGFLDDRGAGGSSLLVLLHLVEDVPELIDLIDGELGSLPTLEDDELSDFIVTVPGPDCAPDLVDPVGSLDLLLFPACDR